MFDLVGGDNHRGTGEWSDKQLPKSLQILLWDLTWERMRCTLNAREPLLDCEAHINVGGFKLGSEHILWAHVPNYQAVFKRTFSFVQAVYNDFTHDRQPCQYIASTIVWKFCKNKMLTWCIVVKLNQFACLKMSPSWWLPILGSPTAEAGFSLLPAAWIQEWSNAGSHSLAREQTVNWNQHVCFWFAMATSNST